MEPTSPAEMRVTNAACEYLQAYLPDFVEHVEQARQEGVPVTVVVDGFVHDGTREGVQACLWYALGNGVPITVRRGGPSPGETPEETSEARGQPR